MITSKAARTERLVARLLVIGVFALLLGTLAAPASAFDRRDAVVLANQFIDRCFAEGGEPIIISTGDPNTIWVACRNGSTLEVCHFWPKTYCERSSILLPNDHGTHGQIPTDAGALDGGRAPQTEGAVASPIGNGELTTRAAKHGDQSHAASHNDQSQGRKGRKHTSHKHKAHAHGKR